MPAEEPVLTFASVADWQRWLSENHSDTPAAWLRLFKKASGKQSITYDEALDTALCFGWIDGLKRSYDSESFIQRFTPRKPKSVWSKRNREHIERLIASERMQPAGLAQVERAKADGRWERAYDGQRDMTVPEDFLIAISKNKKALAFYESLSKANKYAIAWRLQTAKRPETREKRLRAFVQMMRDGKKFHP
jgi:uncharacterized protein YdeI (YjbR/CyaY-like superfamily)